MKKCVTEKFLDYTDRMYPALIDRMDFRNLFMHICFGINVKHNHKNGDLDTEELLIPHRLLCKFANKTGNSKESNWESGKLLKEFRDNVLPELEWNEAYFDGWESKCRAITNRGLSSDTLQMIKDELDDTTSKKYYFDTGKVFDRNSKRAHKQTTLEQYLEDKKYFNLNATQQKIYDRMMERDDRAITEKLHENYNRILIAIDDLQTDVDDHMSLEEKKLQQKKILHSIEEDSRVLYAPTPLKRSPRLHHSSECALSLKSEVRKALCTGWTEADLVSSQFVILSSLLDAKECKSFLDTKQHLWTFLNNGIKPTNSEKKPLKEAIYSICFGKSKTNLKKLLSKYNKVELMDNILIKELLDKREDWFQQIKGNGYITDIWNNNHYLEEAGRKTDIYGNKVWAKERWEGALAATKIQSIEMEIISSIFDLQLNYCNIMLFQHDGFTVSFYNKKLKEANQNTMKKAIRMKAAKVGLQLGIDLSHVKLEFVDLV